MVKNKHSKKNNQSFKEKPKEKQKKPEQNKPSDIVLTWQKEDTKNRSPSERGFHTSTTYGNSRLYITGGDAKNQHFKGLKNKHVDLLEILIYDTQLSKWLPNKDLPPSLPTSRSGHTCNLYNNKLYIYGGKQKHKYLSSLVILDLRKLEHSFKLLVTKEWRKPKFTQENLKTRGAHTASIINHCLFSKSETKISYFSVYGGLTPSEEDGSLIYLSDIIIFDLIKERWTIPIIEGAIPYGRAGHSATVVGQDIFVFGGRSNSLLLQDSYLFSTKKLSWIKIHPSGNIPCARAGHTIENFDDKSLILYGGSNWTLFFSSVFIFNLERAEWREIITDGEIPEPRIWHTSSILGLKMYIFGGGNEKNLFKTFYTLDLFKLKNKDEEEEPIISEDKLIQPVENVKIKTVYNDEIRSFVFPKTFGFEDLLSKLCDEYQQSNLTINYKDDEDDLVTIRGNEDLLETISFFNKVQKNIKFVIRIPKVEGIILSNNNTTSTTTLIKEDKVNPVIGDLLGAGAFGRVFLGMNITNGALIAIKQIPIRGSKNKKNTKEVINEINLMKKLNHDNIVRYLGAEVKDDYLQIYLEYVSGGSIQQLLSKFKKFQESVVKLYTKQILLGLKYLHDNDIIHRDIKGGNILLTENGIIKLADFGHSKSLNELDSKKSYKGTPLWMSPEVASELKYSKSSDIWALGCTIIEMLTGRPPYPELLNEQPWTIISKIGNNAINPTIPENISKELILFLKSCFHKNPSERYSVDKLIELLENDNLDLKMGELNLKSIELMKELDIDEGESSPVNSDYYESFPDDSYHSFKPNKDDDDEYIQNDDDEEEEEEVEEDESEDEEEEESEDEEEKIEVNSYNKSTRIGEELKSINEQVKNFDKYNFGKKSVLPKYNQRSILQLDRKSDKLADKNDIIEFLQQKQRKQNRSIKSFQNQNQKSFNYYN